MSALPVSNRTVNILATFAADHGLHADPARAALMLWRENRTCLRYKYADADRRWPMLARLERDFTYERSESPSLTALCQLILFYEYQSSQHPGWEGSEAERLIRAFPAEPGSR